MDIITTMHYTFSAIAQTAGAILGLGGAVVIFKYQAINKSLIDFRYRIIKKVLSKYEGRVEDDYYRESDFKLLKKVKNNFEKIVTNENVVSENYGHPDKCKTSIKRNLRNYADNIRARNSAISLFIFSAVLLLLVISASLIFITLTDIINEQVFGIISIVSVVAIIASVYSFIRIFLIKYII